MITVTYYTGTEVFHKMKYVFYSLQEVKEEVNQYLSEHDNIDHACISYGPEVEIVENE